MLACGVFQFCQSKFHANHDWRQCFPETNGLLSRLPVAEVCLGTRRILDNQILHPFLQSVCPPEDTLNTCRVWCDKAYSSEARAGTRRDAALKAINACVQRNEVSSRECRKLNANVQTLVEAYKQGDKTVLPTLFRFTYLTDFYGEALLNDPDGFLTAMSQLPDKDQKAVASGIAGGMFGLRSKERFEAIRALLSAIPDSEPIKTTSQVCLKTLERTNASFFQTYFPPRTFSSRAADFQVRWYSADMYALGEKPLWPPSSELETTYRLTYLPAFTGPTVITLSVSPDANGRIAIKTINGDREVTKVDETMSTTQDQVARFFALLDQAHFWTTPTELPRRGLDGAEWIMEGVKDGKYRTVVRWCPDIEHQSAEEISFGEAGRLLFEIAGHKRVGGC